jgi:hypothetical protein
METNSDERTITVRTHTFVMTDDELRRYVDDPEQWAADVRHLLTPPLL